MKKTVFEEMNITYREENGYLIPNLAMPKQTDYPIGKYGRLHQEASTRNLHYFADPRTARSTR